MIVTEGNMDTGNECLYLRSPASSTWIKFDESVVEFRPQDSCIEEVISNKNKYYLIYVDSEFARHQDYYPDYDKQDIQLKPTELIKFNDESSPYQDLVTLEL